MDAPTAVVARELPDAVLARVLAAVNQRHRLGACARVCTAWRAAASAATSRIELGTATAAAFPRLSAWLELQGQHVTSLSLYKKLPWMDEGFNLSDTASGSDDDAYYGADRRLPDPEPLRLRPLPCAGLLHFRASAPGALVLDGGDGADAAAGEHGPLTGLFAAATGLTRLSLDGARLCSAADAMAALARQPALRELSLSIVALQGVFGALPALPQLTKLEFTTHGAGISNASSEKDIAERAGQPAFGVSCPALRHLQLSVDVGVDGWGGDRPELAAVVAGLPELTHLPELRFAVALRHGTEREMAAFVAGVGQLQRLQSLSFDSYDSYDSFSYEQLPDAAAYAALTASSGLTSLMLSCPLPVALDAIFPAGRLLPHLVVCQLAPPTLGDPWQVLQELAFSSVVRACPALRELTLNAAAGSDLSALAAAAQLTKLSGNIAADCVAQVAQQTRLVELDLYLVRSGPDRHASPNLMLLTQLTRLQRISLTSTPEGLHTASIYTIYSTDEMALPWEGDTQGTPVWRQLFYTLLQCPSCRSGLDQQLLAACGAGFAAEVACFRLSAAAQTIRGYYESCSDAVAFAFEREQKLQDVCMRLWLLALPNADPALPGFQQLVDSVCMILGMDDVVEVFDGMMREYVGALQQLMAAGDTYLNALQAAAGGGGGGDGSNADEQG